MVPNAQVFLKKFLFLALLLLATNTIIDAAPSITSLSPTSGAVGASVTIAGSGFGSTQGSSTVKFNGTTATVTSWGSTSIVVTVPSGAATGNVVVTVSGTASNGKSFTVLATPSISSLSPTSGAVGASITISGSNFGSTQGSSTVKFNGTTATVTSWGASSIAATVPSGATTGNVVVHTSGVDTNGVSFTVLPTPSISSLSPTSGAVGASVTIAGSNFGSTQGTSTVKFNGTAASVTSWSASSVIATVPAGATTGNVVVHASGVDSAGKSFTVVPAPNITSLSVTSGGVGAAVTITGTNFGSTQGSSTVKFNGTTATVSTWGASSIAVAVPTGATTGNVVVHASGVDSNGVNFTVLPTPTITSLAPSTAAVGASVVIAGSNFGATQGSSTVTFNGTAASATSWSATSITATVPTGATTGNVVVSVSGVASAGKSFTVVSAPSISSLSKTSATVGTSITITGTNFGSSQGTGTVSFNGTIGTATSWNSTTIKVPVPAGATSGNVVVFASGVNSNGVAFTVIPTPSISSLSPNFGPVGSLVIITGNNFGSSPTGSTVTFNGWAATSTAWSPTSITVAVPSQATTGNVVVTVNSVASNSVAYTVVPTPSISSVSPTSGPVGLPITISGGSFGASQGGSTVSFNGTVGIPTSWSDSSITVPVPSAATNGPLVVTANGVQSNPVSFTLAVLTSIAIPFGNPSVQPGGTLQLTATGVYSDSSWLDVSSTATWTSSNPAAATINSTGLVTGVAFGQTTIQAALGGINQSVTVLVEAANFVATGNLVTYRTQHTSTTLPNGTVLVAGGTNWTGTLSSAELYNPTSGTFGTTGTMTAARSQHTATLLSDGTVLLAGGDTTTGITAEIYNPSTGNFTATGNMVVARGSGYTATLLQNGKVLVVGGATSGSSTAELYDPATGTFTATGTIGTALRFHTATLLSNGQVLITGGVDINNNPYSSAQIYDPISGQFSATGSMSISRVHHTATLLSNGTVLVAGGQADFSGFVPLSSAEIFSSVSGTFSLTGSLISAHTEHTATLLSDGVVLVAGGVNSPTVAAELFYPSTGTFSATSPMVIATPFNHTASLLTNGNVLLAAGVYGSNLAQLYQPTSFTAPPALISLAVSPLNWSLVSGTTYPFSATGVFADGSTEDMTKLVSWSSSVPAVATINTTATATGGTPGTTTITASAGTISGSATLSVDPVTLVSIDVTANSAGILLGGTDQFSATGIYSDGSNQNLTSSVTWSSSATPIATITSTGLATGVGVGNSNISATLGTIQGSTWLSVAATLQALSLSPSTAQIPIGGSVQTVATGTYSNGNSNVTGLSSWSSSNASVATVSNGLVRGLSSGSTTITATYNWYGTQLSSSIEVTVTNQYAPPQISASVYPTQNFAGWTTTNTTVTFTCMPGGLPITGCTPPQTVATEGANQIVTGTVTDSAQTSVSTSVTLYIDKTAPVLTVSLPGGTYVASSTPVTITGTVSDSGSGVGSVTCNGAQANVSSGSFSCTVGLNVGMNTVNVRASDVAGNVTASIFHEILSGTATSPTSLQITPTNVNMLIGNTRQFTAVDQNGLPRTDATWTVSDSTVATITTDSAPTLTGIATGQVTLTANVGSVSAQTQVTISGQASFVPGTVLWSAPTIPGFAVGQVAQALPTQALGLNLYSISTSTDGTRSQIQAFTTDGQMLWQTGPYEFSTLIGPGIPDGFGGLLVTEACTNENPQMTTYDLDGATGNILWAMAIGGFSQGGATACPQAPQFAVRQDGSIVIANPLQTSPRILVVDGPSGNILLNPQLPASTLNGNVSGPVSCDCFTEVGPPMVGPDGSAYVEYEVRQPDTDPNYVSSTLYLMKIGTDNSVTTTQLSSNPIYNLVPGNIIPDGQGGILASWTISPNPGNVVDAPYQAADLTSAGTLVIYALPIKPAQLLLGETHTGQGNNEYSEMLLSDGANIAACAFLFGGATSGNSCATLWTYQSGQSPATAPVNLAYVTQGNGLYATLSTSGTSANLLGFDSGGNILSSVAGVLQPSNAWQGNLFAAMNSTFGEMSPPQSTLADSFWALPGGNQSGNGMAVEQVLSNKTQGPQEQLPDLSAPICNPYPLLLAPPPNPTCGNINAIELITDKTPDFIFQNYIQTYLGNSKKSDGTWYNSLQLFTNPDGTLPVNVTGPNQQLKVTLGAPASYGQAPFTIMTERFDSVNHVISVVTLKGHPLAGWRYWRVYSIGTNDVVIETGAYDQPGPGPLNYFGYYLARGIVLKAWYQYLKVIQNAVSASEGMNLQGTIGGMQIYTYPYDHESLLKGYWDYPATYTNYILNNVCQSTSCN